MSEQLKMKENGKRIHFWLLIVLLSLLIVSCDLFTGSKTDLFQQISDYVDWTNAPKLTVRINYPSAWGISNPPQGSITHARDIRKGYEFSVEFTPYTAYTLRSWHIFRTSNPDNLGNWLENPALINPKDIEPAMTNLGNLALIERDFATAERWFRQALSKDGKNSAALRGLEQVAKNK